MRILFLVFTLALIPFVLQQSHASCAPNHYPCFDHIAVYPDIELTEDYIMKELGKQLNNQHDDWQVPERGWDIFGSPVTLPAVICTEYLADNNRHWLMAKWQSSHEISEWASHYDPDMCQKWLPPLEPIIRVMFDKSSYYSGEQAKITVVDPSRNNNSKNLDYFTIHVYSDVDEKGINVEVLETGENTHVFQAMVFVSSYSHSSDSRIQAENVFYAEYQNTVAYSEIRKTEANIDKKLTNSKIHHLDDIPPLKQAKNNIPIWDIKCKENLQLAYQVISLDPICVTFSTYDELIKRNLLELNLVPFGVPNDRDNICKHNPDVEQVQRSCGAI